MQAITYRRLLASDAASYKALRLESLHSHPEAFSASWEDEHGKPVAWFAERLENSFVVGAWHGQVLAGVAGLFVPASPKLNHKNTLWGVYVRPQARGTGLAAELLKQVIAQAATRAEEILLTVSASNLPALQLYRKAGFVEYGVERRALKLGERYYDEILMSLPLTQAGRDSTTQTS